MTAQVFSWGPRKQPAPVRQAKPEEVFDAVTGEIGWRYPNGMIVSDAEHKRNPPATDEQKLQARIARIDKFRADNEDPPIVRTRHPATATATALSMSGAGDGDDGIAMSADGD